MSSSDSPVPNCSIKAEYSPMLSDLHEILQSTAEPNNGSNGFNVKISASDKNTGAKSNDLSAGFRPQLDEDTAVAVRVRDLERMKELDNFIASALAQFQFDEFIKRLTMAKGELQRFYTCKTQIDADQGEEINSNIEIMKADLLESNKVLSIIMEQVCTFKHLKAEFPESKEEESAFEKQEVTYHDRSMFENIGRKMEKLLKWRNRHPETFKVEGEVATPVSYEPFKLSSKKVTTESGLTPALASIICLVNVTGNESLAAFLAPNYRGQNNHPARAE
ncbi:hypothetical protein ABEW05_008272 [Botrytis cinerea]